LLPPLPLEPFVVLCGSKLCLLKGLSLLSPKSFLFLLLSFENRARSSGASRNLTILLLFILTWSCLGGAGADRGTGVAVADRGGGATAALGRGGAGVDGREEGADGPGTVLVLILSLGAADGMGELMAGGVEMAGGILTVTGLERGGIDDAAEGAAGGAAGVFATGADVGVCLRGATVGGETRTGSTGDSRLTAVGRGAGDAFTIVGAVAGAGDDAEADPDTEVGKGAVTGVGLGAGFGAGFEACFGACFEAGDAV
jgi:hypothetical protein